MEKNQETTVVPACYVPVCLKKKHNARKAVWFTKATVHWSNFCTFVDSTDSQIILRMILESKRKMKREVFSVRYNEATASAKISLYKNDFEQGKR